jgi:hypothetical protein
MTQEEMKKYGVAMRNEDEDMKSSLNFNELHNETKELVLQANSNIEEKINIIKLSKAEVIKLKTEGKSLEEMTDYFLPAWNGKVQLLKAKIILYMSDQKAGGHSSKYPTASSIVEFVPEASVNEGSINEKQETVEASEASTEENIEQIIEDFRPAINDIKTIDYLQDKLSPEQFEGFCIGNAIDCLSEYRFKGGLCVLKKAASYVDKIIQIKEMV